MNRTISSVLALVALMGLGETSVLAQATPVAVLGVEAMDAPANRAACLTELLKGEVKKAPGHTLTPGKDLDEIKLVFGCVDEKPACMARAGKGLQAAKLLWGSLKKGPAGFVVTVKVLDVASGKMLNELSEAVAKRALEDNCAADAVGTIARSIFASNRGSIKVSANVSGAQVMLGPTVIGLTYDMPIVLKDLPPGQYKIVIRKDGYHPWDRSVTIKGGQVLEVTADLREIGKGPTPDPGEGDGKPSSGRLGWKIAFWTSAALTVGMATGMGVSGAQVLGVESDKDDFIHAYRTKMNNNNLLTDDQDVCEQSVTGADNQSALADICDRGSSKATMTNVFLGLTLAAAAASGFFYYKAYMGQETPAEEPKEGGDAAKPAEASVRWMLSPTAGPSGAGLGFQMSF